MASREFYLARSEPMPLARAVLLAAGILLAGTLLLVWIVLDPSESVGDDALGYVAGGALALSGAGALVGVIVQAARRRRQPAPEPVLLLDDGGFTAWGGLRVRWTDVVSWEVYRHHGLYELTEDERDPDDPDDIHEEVDELLVFVTVRHPEAILRRLEPDVRDAYLDSELNDEHGRPIEPRSPIRFGVDGLDVPDDEVIAEVERLSGMPPISRPART
ncbi:hypothetical protein [Promicromonospora sp. NPDC050249]|uniref:hypothetical protein n=1 Tax=Promicromonospora sp. NPDC050249 TaxID=3154743 RepID=UPI0033E0B6C8